jgi:hypothetical protein
MDDRLRRLERRAGGNDLEARTRLVSQRLRAGQLSLEHARLAAYLGDEAARAALGEDAPPSASDLADLRVWLEHLRGYGTEVVLRAARAAADVALQIYEEAYPDDDRLRAALRAHDAYLAAPEALAWPQDLAYQANRAAQEASDGASPWAAGACQALVFAGKWIRDGPHTVQDEEALYAHLHVTVDSAARATSPATLQAALRSELIAWALAT